jgi:DNA-binding NtrC family response regulator
VQTLLIVEDKQSMAQMLKETLEAEGYRALTARDVAEGVSLMRASGPDLVLTDLQLPDGTGIDVLGLSRDMDPLRPVIVMTAFGSVETAVDAMKLGAFDFITKPFNVDHLLVLIGRALESRRMTTENMVMRDVFSVSMGAPEIVGSSGAIRDVAASIQRVAPTKTTVLLLGKSGTGKELFARALHHLSDRHESAFVPVNCAAIPRDLLESELFGHEKGAFTGATTRRLGKFELAHRGTLFLDEIGELDVTLQSKLLRALQEDEIQRVGGQEPVKVDVRVVAASNRNLEADIEAGRFREDLFYRISAFPVRLPTLRERPGDIPLLAQYFLKQLASELKSGVKAISQGAMDELSARPWKGNVRELANTIERAMILCDGDTLLREHLGASAAPSVSGGDEQGEPKTLEEAARAAQRVAETAMIGRAMKESGGNKTRAAQALGVSYKTLLTKIKDYGIN